MDLNNVRTCILIKKVTYLPFTCRALFEAEYKDSMEALRAKQDKDKQHIEQLTAERLKLINILEDMQTVVQNNEE